MRQTKICTGCGMEKASSDFHPDPRLKSGLRSRCKVCCNLQSSKCRKENPEKYKASKRRSEAKYKDRVVVRHKRWRAKNPDRARELSIESMNKWRRENPEEARLASRVQRAKRCSRQKQATLPGHKRYIKYVYEMASNFGLTVDHEVPLHGKNVSGLHVPWNLRLMSKSANSAKGNRFAA